MADHTRALRTAQRLIAANARPIRLQRAGGGEAVPGKPLHGPAPAPAPVDALGCFVQPSSLQALGYGVVVSGVFKNCSQIALVAADGVNDHTEAKLLYDSDGSVWKVEHVELLKPAEVAIMYFIGVRRP